MHLRAFLSLLAKLARQAAMVSSSESWRAKLPSKLEPALKLDGQESFVGEITMLAAGGGARHEKRRKLW